MDEQVNLSDMNTRWTQISRAKTPQGAEPAAARNDLLNRYDQAIRSYLLAELRDPHAADKVASDFAVRILEVDAVLQRADPNRGRFRDYLKAVLRRMVIDHYRAEQRRHKKVRELVPGGEHEPAISEDMTAEEDRRFVDFWRQELINQAWHALEQVEQKNSQPYSLVLRLQKEQPGIRSAQLAEQLSAQLGKPYTAANVRQLVHRGRELLGKLIVEEVARSLRAAPNDKITADKLEQELIDLGLLFSYCKEALEEWPA